MQPVQAQTGPCSLREKAAPMDSGASGPMGCRHDPRGLMLSPPGGGDRGGSWATEPCRGRGEA